VREARASSTELATTTVNGAGLDHITFSVAQGCAADSERYGPLKVVHNDGRRAHANRARTGDLCVEPTSPYVPIWRGLQHLSRDVLCARSVRGAGFPDRQIWRGGGLGGRGFLLDGARRCGGGRRRRCSLRGQWGRPAGVQGVRGRAARHVWVPAWISNQDLADQDSQSPRALLFERLRSFATRTMHVVRGCRIRCRWLSCRRWRVGPTICTRW
jgi:hypothetical protein